MKTPPSALPEAVAWQYRVTYPRGMTGPWEPNESAESQARTVDRINATDEYRAEGRELFSAAQLTARDAQWREVVEGLRVELARAEIRRNDDGTLDEVVGTGPFHLEQMNHDHWSLRLGPHLIGLHSVKRIKAMVSENDHG